MALSVDATSMKITIDQSKTAIDRTAKGLGDICSYMSSINSKQAKIRDRGDAMAKSTLEYANTDLPTMQTGLEVFGRTMANVQEYREAYIQSVDQNVITPIHYYDRECKDARTELTKLEKENKKYEKTLRNPNSPDSAIVRTRVQQSAEKMKTSILEFEGKRLADSKKHLMEYCRLEMTFAAKCLEQFSQCYQELAKVTPEEDLIAFEKILSPQRLMTSLGFNNQRNVREQNLVTQLQNTSLSQPKSLQQSSQQFQSSFASNLRSSSNVSYGTPVQSTARSQHSANSMQQNETTVTQIQMPSARSSNGNVDDDEDEEEETETESEEDEPHPARSTTRASAWAQ